MSKFLTCKNGVSQIERAKIIQRTLGVQVAARYLRNRDWSIQAALYLLASV